MRQIRLALLEADVNFQVVKRFTAQVKERALGQAGSTAGCQGARAAARPRRYLANSYACAVTPREQPTAVAATQPSCDHSWSE